MKTIYFLLFSLLMGTAGFAQSYEVITVPAPGGLNDCLNDDTWADMDSIVVKGTINKDDCMTLYNCSRYGKLSVFNLEGVTFVDNKIPDRAFCNPSLTLNLLEVRKIMLPDNVTEIGAAAFACTGIESINLPSSVKKISSSAFMCCHHLGGEIVIPEGVAEIGHMCFHLCQKLKKVVLPSTIKKIGYSAFYLNYELEEINFPDGLEEIGEEAFASTIKLTEIVLPESIVSLGVRCFCDNFALRSIKLPQGITEIPEGLLELNRDLTSIDIPDNVTEIHDRAFYGPIKEVHLPKNLKRIGQEAFRYNCLTEVLLPASVEYIDQHAFNGSKLLERVYCMAQTPPMTAYYYINDYQENEPFCIFHSEKECTLYVPVGSGDLYRESPFWVDFKNIVETDKFPSSIETALVPDCTVTSHDGMIFVDNVGNKAVSVKINALNGCLVRNESINETATFPLESGFYLVKIENQTYKVLVK